jgi:hypothetical protein
VKREGLKRHVAGIRGIRNPEKTLFMKSKRKKGLLRILAVGELY